MALFHLLSCRTCRLEMAELLLRGEAPFDPTEPLEEDRNLVDDAGGEPHFRIWNLLAAFDAYSPPHDDALSLGLHELHAATQAWGREDASSSFRLFRAAELFAEGSHHREEAVARHMLGLFFVGQSDPLAALDCFESSALDATSDPDLTLFSAFAKADCFAMANALPDARRCLDEARALYPLLVREQTVPHVLWLEGRVAMRLGEANAVYQLRASVADFCRRELFEEAFLAAVDLISELRLHDRLARSTAVNPQATEVLSILRLTFGSSGQHRATLEALDDSLPTLPDCVTDLHALVSSLCRFRPLTNIDLGSMEG